MKVECWWDEENTRCGYREVKEGELAMMRFGQWPDRGGFCRARWRTFRFYSQCSKNLLEYFKQRSAMIILILKSHPPLNVPQWIWLKESSYQTTSSDTWFVGKRRKEKYVSKTLLLLLLSHFSRVRLCATPGTTAHRYIISTILILSWNSQTWMNSGEICSGSKISYSRYGMCFWNGVDNSLDAKSDYKRRSKGDLWGSGLNVRVVNGGIIYGEKIPLGGGKHLNHP